MKVLTFHHEFLIKPIVSSHLLLKPGKHWQSLLWKLQGFWDQREELCKCFKGKNEYLMETLCTTTVYGKSFDAWADNGTQCDITTGFSKMSLTSSMALVSAFSPTIQCVIISLAYLNDFEPPLVSSDWTYQIGNISIYKINNFIFHGFDSFKILIPFHLDCQSKNISLLPEI